MVKRLGIYVFYNKTGKVNGYVKYLLMEMKKVLTDIVVVCNGDLDDCGREFFLDHAMHLFMRENQGFDAGAYKDIILIELGIEKIREYNALVLFNSSFYGPLYPIKDVFMSMESKGLDFWGITAGGNSKSGSTPYHIQSYFLVMMQSILQSQDFEEYWRTQKECTIFHDAVVNFELCITPFFTSRGYRCDTYNSLEVIRESSRREGNLLHQLQYELIYDYKCPILKKKYICSPVSWAINQNNEDLLHYISTKTKYDTDLIWEDMINEYSPYELKVRRYLGYVLSPRGNGRNEKDKLHIVLWSRQYANYIEYIKKNKIDAKLFIILDEGLKILPAEDEDMLFFRDSGDLLANFNAAMEYFEQEVFCVIADDSSNYDTIDNERYVNDVCNKLIGSNGYIQQVNDLFRDNMRLGLLLPTPMCTKEYFEKIGVNDCLSREDGILLSSIGYRSNEYEIGEKMLRSKGCFWIRSQIFRQKELCKLVCCEKYPFFNILPYLCKKEGYFTGTVNNTAEMSKECSLKDGILTDLFTAINQNIVYNMIEQIPGKLFRKGVVEFAMEFQGVYIYGTGLYGRKCFELLKEQGVKVLGFIVSANPQKSFMGYAVSRIDDVAFGSDEAVIVAMKKDFQEEVRGILKRFSVDNVYYI